MLRYSFTKTLTTHLNRQGQLFNVNKYEFGNWHLLHKTTQKKTKNSESIDKETYSETTTPKQV